MCTLILDSLQSIQDIFFGGSEPTQIYTLRERLQTQTPAFFFLLLNVDAEIKGKIMDMEVMDCASCSTCAASACRASAQQLTKVSWSLSTIAWTTTSSRDSP